MYCLRYLISYQLIKFNIAPGNMLFNIKVLKFSLVLKMYVMCTNCTCLAPELFLIKPHNIYIFLFFNGELRKKYLPGYLTYLALCLHVPALLVFCLAGKQIQVFAGKRYKISSL